MRPHPVTRGGREQFLPHLSHLNTRVRRRQSLLGRKSDEIIPRTTLDCQMLQMRTGLMACLSFSPVTHEVSQNRTLTRGAQRDPLTYEL